MNRLILVGNGFDLAHGSKTSYDDFIKWYLTEALKIVGENRIYEDELLVVKKDNYGDTINFSGHSRTEAELVELFYQRGFHDLINNIDFKTDGWNNTWRSTFLFTIKSTLIENLLDNCSAAKWVDIENIFYDHLKNVLSAKKEDQKAQLLADINGSLAEVIRLLRVYLASLPQPETIDAFRLLMEETIKRSDIVLPNKLREDQLPGALHILNFNYTSTVAAYLAAPTSRNSVTLNHIHGEINNTSNPMIFGFGDELDEDYVKMEAERTKGFFEYIKSFWYFRTNNYHDLIRFIDGEEFQVYILGHSCGLSDRTMLNMIFEHDNCKSIKIFYHQLPGEKNNHTALTQEIARHFRNKGVMRKKIVSFVKSQPMPQYSDRTSAIK